MTRIGTMLKWVLAVVALGLLTCAIAIAILAAQTKSLQRGDRQTLAPKGGVYVAAYDTRLFVQRVGNEAAPAVVFIHGTGSWSEAWRASMLQAVTLGYQAIAIDLPPFGYSELPLSGDYSKSRQAKRILAALDALGIHQATFVAHSFGSAPVVEAIMLAPQRTTSLVLVDAALGLDAPQTDGSDSQLQKLLRHRWIGEAISAAFLTNPHFTEKLLHSFVSEREKITPEWIRLYQQPLASAGAYQGVARWLPELVSTRGRDRSDDIGAYAKLRFPITLIWGETDAITSLSQAEHLKTFMPGSTLVKIPKAGHIPQIEEPDAFLAALADALKRRP